MAEYIDRDALLKDAMQDKAIAACLADIVDVKRLIEDQPAADVEEVKHGRWMPNGIRGAQTWTCSKCKTLGSPHWKRCPVCEAKMIGGKGNG